MQALQSKHNAAVHVQTSGLSSHIPYIFYFHTHQGGGVNPGTVPEPAGK